MKTKIHIGADEGVFYVGAMNNDTDYILWQSSELDLQEIYFEYNDQINSGYESVKECTVDNDACHIVLKTGEVVSFYWNPPKHDQLGEFVEHLKKVYARNPSIIEDLRS